jgi:phosphoribosyl 1,2-cyclic phosphodiesterase
VIARFWGVRGSTAVPDASHLRYGGNTCCVEVIDDAGGLLVLDAGTGFCQLSDSLLDGPFGRGEGELTVLLSKTHWDHLLGFPFAGIVHRPGNHIIVYGPDHAGRRIEEIYEQILAPAYSPFFALANMGASHEFRPIREEAFRHGAVQLSARLLPDGGQGSWGYRVEGAGSALAYISDARYPECRPTPGALTLARGVDLLIHGAASTLAEQQAGETQCSIEEALALAIEAGARRLVLCHHAPERTDDAIDALLERYRAQLRAQGHRLALDAASEGMTVQL